MATVTPAKAATLAPASWLALFVLDAPAAADVLAAPPAADPEDDADDALAVVRVEGVVAAGADEEGPVVAEPPIGAVD
jgi:hypothetical protein